MNMDGVGKVARLVDNLYKAGLVDIVTRTPSGMDYYRVSIQGHNFLNEMN